MNRNKRGRLGCTHRWLEGKWRQRWLVDWLNKEDVNNKNNNKAIKNKTKQKQRLACWSSLRCLSRSVRSKKTLFDWVVYNPWIELCLHFCPSQLLQRKEKRDWTACDWPRRSTGQLPWARARQRTITPCFHSLSNRKEKRTAGVLNLPSVAEAAGIEGDRLVLLSCCLDESENAQPRVKNKGPFSFTHTVHAIESLALVWP